MNLVQYFSRVVAPCVLVAATAVTGVNNALAGPSPEVVEAIESPPVAVMVQRQADCYAEYRRRWNACLREVEVGTVAVNEQKYANEISHTLVKEASSRPSVSASRDLLGNYTLHVVRSRVTPMAFPG